MRIVKLVLLFLWTALAVAARRLVHGPRRPRWGWLLEATVELIRHFLARTSREAGQSIEELRLDGPALRRLRRSLTPETLPVSSVLARTRTEAVTAGGVRAEWISPSGREPWRLLVYLHGGAYIACSLDSHRELMARLAHACHARVLAVDYRLAPEHPFPAALDDAVAAYRWLLGQGADAAQVVIAGDSAGGGLSVATLLWLRDHGATLPAAGVLLSPWVDVNGSGGSIDENAPYDYLGAGTTSLHAVARLYAEEAELRLPYVSPLYGDLRGLPPLLVHAGGAEILRDQIAAFASRAEEAGVEVTHEVWPDMVHVWHAFAPVCRDGRSAIGRIGAYVRGRLSETPEVSMPQTLADGTGG